ncbi:YciI family protein [Pelagicoccus mobilis]|uniref:YCII-related domain-containing protein n=1 Tax=Pelagicoccus mobilis TaxID=415221 RepID=A0A934RYT2_9BACT|nr:YciI family protein [Pelagicoccus mobilis]MBK1878833.1 hypothetical protein [Pelagicoccus mobilis]
MPKQNYLCIQRSPAGNCEPPPPSQMQEMFAKFQSWSEKFKDNFVDMGGKLAEGGKVVGAEGTVDGPFAESKEIAGGYMIISAESMEEAIKIVEESPGIGMPGSTVEIRQIQTP